MQRAASSYKDEHLALRDNWDLPGRCGRRSGSFYCTPLSLLQGNREYRVQWETFYNQVNRPDLIPAYQRRQRVREALFWIGTFSIPVGLSMFVLGVFAPYGGLDPSTEYTLLGVGGGLVISGITNTIISARLYPHAVGRAELQRLVDAYNQSLPAH